MAKTKHIAVPKNPLIADDCAGDTIRKCAQAIMFIESALPSIANAGGVMDDELSHGVSWLLGAVRDALDYEATKAQA